MLRKVTELLFGKKAADHLLASHEQHTQAHQQQQARKDYIAREAAIGARLLGPIPSGHIREFFCLDQHTWVWSESWRDKNGQPQQFTVNYEIDPAGILKRVNGGHYTKLQGQELHNFHTAITKYYQEVSTRIYGVQPTIPA